MNIQLSSINYFFALFLFSSFIIFTGCKDDDVADASTSVNLPANLLGTYTGTLVFTSTSGGNITNLDGTASVEESGSFYAINFSDGVNSLSGLKFIKDPDEESYISVSDTDSTEGVVIENDMLTIGVTNSSGSNWQFVGEK